MNGKGLAVLELLVLHFNAGHFLCWQSDNPAIDKLDTFLCRQPDKSARLAGDLESVHRDNNFYVMKTILTTMRDYGRLSNNFLMYEC